MKSKQKKSGTSPAKLKKSLTKPSKPKSRSTTPAKRGKTWYDMSRVLDWVEATTNADIRSTGNLSPEQIEVRNSKLFPLIKESCKSDEEQRILIPAAAMDKFLKYTGSIIPDSPDLPQMFHDFHKKQV